MVWKSFTNSYSGTFFSDPSAHEEEGPIIFHSKTSRGQDQEGEEGGGGA